MPKHSRRYNAVAERIPEDSVYQPREAIDLVKELSTAKFDETMEVHLRTNADVRHAEQQVRGVTVLPHGLGKQVRVLVFANGEAADIARQAGADYVGDDDLIAQVESGWVEFDVGLAIPEIMSKIGRLGRVLGRRGADAQPAHRHPGARPGSAPGHPGVQGRTPGVSHRPHRHHPRPVRQVLL